MFYIVAKLFDDRPVFLTEFGWTLDPSTARRYDRVGAELACIMRRGWWIEELRSAAA